jgi:hypothetical protein
MIAQNAREELFSMVEPDAMVDKTGHHILRHILTLNRIGLCVAAVSSSPTIIVKHREMLCQQSGQLCCSGINGPILKGSTHQEECRSLTEPIIGNNRSIL